MVLGKVLAERGVLRLDGGFGTLLQARGLQPGESPDDWEAQLWEELQVLIGRPGHTVIVSADICGDGADSPMAMARTFFDGGAMHGDLALVESALSARCSE